VRSRSTFAAAAKTELLALSVELASEAASLTWSIANRMAPSASPDACALLINCCVLASNSPILVD